MDTNKTNPIRFKQSKEAVIASATTFVLTSMFYVMAFMLYPTASLLHK